MAADHLAASFESQTSYFLGIEEMGPVSLAPDVICADINKASDIFHNVRSFKLLRLSNLTELPFAKEALSSTEVLYLEGVAPRICFSDLTHLRTVVFAQIQASELEASDLVFPAKCAVYFDLSGSTEKLQQVFPSATFGTAPPFWKITNQELSLSEDAGKLLQPSESQPADTAFTDEELRAHWKSSSFLAIHGLQQRLEDTKIAIIGSGINLSPDQRPWIAAGRGFAEGSLWFFDFIGQGTAQARALMQIAPGAKLFIGKVTNPQGRITASAVALALRWAIDQRVDVITLAFEINEDPTIEELISKATSEGIVVVAAAGPHPRFPATLESVVVAGPASNNCFSHPAFFAGDSAAHSVAGAIAGGLCSLLAALAKLSNWRLNSHKLKVLLRRVLLAPSHAEALVLLDRIIAAPSSFQEFVEE